MLSGPARGVMLAVLALLGLLTFTPAAKAQTLGLVAAYGFSENGGPTVADQSGNSNTGTLGSGVAWTTQGKYGSALVFNGTSGRVTVPNAASLQLTNGMTLEAWVNPSAVTNSWRDVIYKGNDNYYLEATSTNSLRPGAGGTFGEAYGTAALAANTWTHLAVTYDRTAVRLYVNGVQVSSAAATAAIVTSTNPLQIGSDSIFGQYFQGTIDEVRIYNRALTVAEIQADMNTPVGGTSPPDTTAPTVAITVPTSAATYSTNTTPLTVGGAAADNVGVSQVTWASNQGGSGTATGTTSWTAGGIPLLAGANVITVTAKDAAQNGGTATLTVTYDPTAPTVSLTAPAANTTLTGTINVTATAGDDIGVAGVQFLLDGASLGAEQTTVPYAYAWNTSSVPNGGHTLSARARDAAGNTTLAADVSVMVSNAQPSSLVAAYGFSEGAGSVVADQSGNNNTGALGSGVTWTTQGKYGSALVFNGTIGRVTINDSPSLRLTNGMTLEAWVNPSAVTNSWRDVIYKGNDNYYLEATSTISSRPGAGGTFGTAYGTGALAANTWTHLAVTYDRTAVRLYVNGVQVSSVAATAAIAMSTNPLQLGGDSIFGQYFQGTIDEVRIYNRALTVAEIQADMNTAIGGTPLPPDPTPPTVAISAPAANSTVFSLVTVAANASDNVGIAGVQFFVDGQPLGAEVTTAPYAVIWDTAGSSQGSHTLAAVARDFGNNSTPSAPVPVTVVATTPSLVGQWAAPFSWPIVAVHSHLLPTGEILASDGQTAGNVARVWNPTTNTFTNVNNKTTNIFCAGHCLLADGRVLVAGGHVTGHVGVTDTNLFNATTRKWSRVASMHTARWYPTATTLPDGRVLVTAGEMGCAECDAPIPEVYNPQTNTWTELTAANLPLPYYPHMFVLPDGRVLASSTSEHPIISQVLDVNAQTWAVVDPEPVDGGSAAMYLPGKVLKAGSSYHPDDPVVPSVETTYVIDMTQPSPAWRQTPSMTFPRTYHTLTILPDGRVLVTGGGETTDAVGVGDAVMPAELWSPDTETWTVMASMSAPRLYHSTALLMPDGRVLALGGGRFNGVNEPTDQRSAQFYSPPYLFKGSRPTITSAPPTNTYGGTFNVQTPDASRIAAVSFIRLGSVTHAINMDQRLVPLAFTAGSGSLSVQAPANANLAPPGYYMLFILDANGVPSVAAILKIN